MNDINVNRIFAAFNRSGKKHILITGEKGSGKTTLAKKMAGNKCAGFESYAVPQKEVVIVNRLTGEKAIIGHYSKELGRMEPNLEGFDTGIKSLKKALGYNGNILLDEIGYLENDALDFQRAVIDLMDRKSVILTVRKDKTDFIQSIGERDDVFIVDMDVLQKKLGCVIMASGYSRRFGENKLLQNFGDKKLIERAIIATDGMFSHRVVVTRYQEIAEICERAGIDYILHSEPDRSDTVKLGLGDMQETDGCMFVPCDQPLLERSTVMKLVQNFLSKKNIWRLAYKGEVGMPVIFPNDLYVELLKLKNGGGSAVIKNHPHMVRFLEIDKREELVDADTPEMLEFLEKQYL